MGWVKLLSIWGVGIVIAVKVLFMLIAISIIAMVWTFYNLLFDKVFTGNKRAPSLAARLAYLGV